MCPAYGETRAACTYIGQYKLYTVFAVYSGYQSTLHTAVYTAEYDVFFSLQNDMRWKSVH